MTFPISMVDLNIITFNSQYCKDRFATHNCSMLTSNGRLVDPGTVCDDDEVGVITGGPGDADDEFIVGVDGEKVTSADATDVVFILDGVDAARYPPRKLPSEQHSRYETHHLMNKTIIRVLLFFLLI